MTWELRTIHDKDVYVIEHHQHAIECWALIRQGCHFAPGLITLDEHTDTRLAFTRDTCGRIDPIGHEEEFFEEVVRQCDRVDYMERASVESAVSRLRNDEHIDAAIRAGMLDHAFVCCFRSDDATRPKHQPSLREVFDHVETTGSTDIGGIAFAPYDMPEQRIFVVAPASDGVNTEDRSLFDQAIESSYLDGVLNQIRAISNSVGLEDPTGGSFVLDIDLDYFHTRRSVSPEDPNTIQRLIRDAVAITIAKEPWYVRTGQLNGENLDSEWLLKQVLQLITDAFDG